MPKPTFFNLPPDKRARIIEVAIEEFASKTYDQASLSQIVQRAEISKGSMYQYFANKLDLFTFLVFDEAARRKLAYFENPAALMNFADDPDFDLFGLLRVSCHAGIRFTRDHPRLASVALALTRPTSSPEVTGLQQRFDAEGNAYLHAMLGHAVALGQVRADLDLSVLTPLLRHITGPMIFDQIAAALSVSVQDFLDEPKIVRRLTQADIDRIIDTSLSLLERGIATETRP